MARVRPVLADAPALGALRQECHTKGTCVRPDHPNPPHHHHHCKKREGHRELQHDTGWVLS